MADFLDEMLPTNPGSEPDPEVPTPEPIVEEPVEAATPAPEPTQPEVALAEPQRPEAGFVPIAALLEERDKRKQFEDRVRAFETQQPRAPTATPDPYDDPEGFARHQERMVDERMTAMRFQFSDQFARQQHGAEKVDAATQWAKEKAEADPMFAMRYMQEQNPIDWIVQQHKREALLSDIGDRSIEDVVRDYLAKNPEFAMPSAPAVAATPVVAAPQAPKPATPPRSIASDAAAPSTGRDASPMAELDAIFNRR